MAVHKAQKKVRKTPVKRKVPKKKTAPLKVKRKAPKKKITPKSPEKRGLFAPRKISKKRQKEIRHSLVKAIELLGNDPGLFAQEFVRGTGSGSFLFGTPKSQSLKKKRKKK